MKKILKVLHLASFTGNIGDCANHSGSRKNFEKNLGFDLEYTNLEIRRFYWKELNFDIDFVEIANRHDLVIVGGGNYFELWVDNSQTGTSIDISLESLEKIDTPILFYALGVDVGQGVSGKALSKFRNFIDFLREQDKYYISVRNDGALDAVKMNLGVSYLECFHSVPDGGFFTEVDNKASMPGVDFNSEFVIGVNLANDMPEVRFKDGSEIDAFRLSYKEFIAKFADLVNSTLEKYENSKIIFFAHIFRDLEVISSVLSFIHDPLRRSRVLVAPYASGFTAQSHIFGLYSQCKLILGMRFHSNVCAISQNVPTIGLVNYRQIGHLYREMGLEDRMVKVDAPEFDMEIMSLIDSTIENYTAVKARYKQVLEEQQAKIDIMHRGVNSWLHRCVVGVEAEE